MFVSPRFLSRIPKWLAEGARPKAGHGWRLGAGLAVAMAALTGMVASPAPVAAQAPVARTSGPYTGTAGTPIRFSGSRSKDYTGSPLTFAWTFGDGGTGSGVELSHTYAAGGTYTVTLTVTNQSGLSGTTTTTATVTGTGPAKPPVASAGGPYSGVAGKAVAFNGTGSSDPGGLSLTYAWAFGDGSSGTGVSPVHTYVSPGSYTATLTVTNSASLSSSSTASVTIAAAPQPPVANAGGPYTGVTGTAVAFSGAGSSDPGGLALSYAWTFGDGGTATGVSPTHKYAAAGTYTATLTVTNSASLSNSATAAVTITAGLQPPVANAGGPYTGVVGTAVSFSGAGSSDPKGEQLTYAWTFGDGSTGTGVAPTHAYATAGTFTVQLTVTNTDNLSASATTTAKVATSGQAPVAHTSGPYNGAAGAAIRFSGSRSKDPAGSPLTYAWNFGDGGTGNVVELSHTYAAGGTYTVTLTVTNQLGLSNTTTTTATVTGAGSTKPPVAKAGGPYTGVAGTAVSFSGAGSSDPGGLALTYAWAFGDGGTGTGVSPTHTYASAGTYTATLTVTNSASLSNSSTASVTITAAPKPPVANAGGPYTGVAGTAVSFSGAGSSDPGGLALSYAWAFGDGGTGTGVSPSHTYASAGTYTATLTVTNTASLTNSSTASVTIAAAPQPPVASAGGPYTGVAGSAVSFSGAGSTDPKNEVLTYAWTFGDGGTATGVAPNHTYASAGTYTVKLTLTNTDNLSNSSTTSATITAAPQAPVANAGGPYSGVAGTAVSFSGAGSSDPGGLSLTYAWAFGDGGTGTGVSPTHTYASAGTYTATLTVTNTASLSNSSTATVTVTAAPQAPVAKAGGPYSGVAGTNVAFNGSGSSDPGGLALTYAWAFGDGATGTGASPTHIYAASGSYTATLTVTNTASLSNSSTASVSITAAPQPPVANAGGPYTGVAGTAVSFSGSGSSDPQNETLTYAWSFGDGTTGTGVSPTHTYAAAGSYTVSLAVTNTDSLSSNATATATITAAAQAPVANAGGPYTGSAGTAVSFSGAGSSDPKGETLSYAWTFGDGSTGTGVAPTHTYAASGSYTVSLTVTNTDNLSNTASTTATIANAAGQPPVANAGGPYGGVAGTAISFSGAGSSDPKSEALTYAWSFGDGSGGSGVAPTHTYAAAGSYTVTLTVTNTDNLSKAASTTATITAAAPKTPTANAGGPYAGSAGAAVNFSGLQSSDPSNLAAAGYALTYVWNFGDGGTGAGPTPVHTYAAAGTYTVSMMVTTASGGTATGTATATIDAGSPVAGAPTANAGGPYAGTQSSAIAFNGSASSDPNALPLTYSWDFGDGTTATGVNPTHAYGKGATYSVALTVSNGTASSTASTVATVTGPTSLSVNAGGPYSGTAKKALMLDGTHTNNPNSRQLSYLWDFGDGSTSAGAQPTHIYAAQGSYTVSLTVTDGQISGNATTTAAVAAPAAESITASAGGPYAETTGRTVTFDASASIDSDGNPLTYAWSFGDGTTGTGTTPSHAYTTKGTYTATVTATSGSVTGTATATVVVTQSIAVTISSPAANTLYGGAATATVTGTVSASNLTVNVNGTAASVSGMNFTATGVSLREGVNLLVATATDNSGGVGTGAVSVILDATAPTVAITSPANNAIVTTPAITVAGLVNDIVTGTIGSTDVTVKVNGVAAQVANRSFSLPSQLLTPGANTVTATAVDNVGNTSASSVTVFYTPPQNQLALNILNGNGQTGAVGSVLPQPLVVQLVAADGTPVVGRPVTFTVTRSDGQVEVAPTLAQSLFVTTDKAGKASVLFQLGSRTGLAVNQVSATTPGATAVTFTANSTSGTPTQIHIVRGASQRGLLGEPLAEGLQVIVADAFSNPIAGVPVGFTVSSGDGTLDKTTATTDMNGKALANLTLGTQEGINNYGVSADFTGDTGAPVVFLASGYAPGPVAATSVSGVVLDNGNTPIQNATVKLLGTTLGTTTDVNGRFNISGAPVGTVTLSVDGSTSTSTQTFPFLSFVLEDLPGQNNTLNKPIYLPSIDVNDAQTVGGSDPVTLTMAGVPGVSFTVAPNSVTFPDGSTVGKLSISQVKSDMVPMEPTNGSGPDLIWTLQPAGTRFSVPVKITLPNTQGLAPGTVSEFFQYDHDLEQFVSAGTAHVSADGSVIVSDDGFGITKAGWGHGPTFPLPGNCTVSCSNKNPCIRVSPAPTGCSCVGQYNNGVACGSNTNIGICQLPGTCKNGVCSGGNKPDGSYCNNGVFCKQPESCTGGVCDGKDIGPVKDQTRAAAIATITGLAKDFDAIANPVAIFFNKFALGFSITPKVSETADDQLICCESLKQLNVLQARDQGQFDLTVSVGPIGVPYLSVPTPLGPQGFTATLSGGLNFTFTHQTSVCDNDDCYSGEFKVGLGMTGALQFQLPSVSAAVTLTGGIETDFQIGCHEISGTLQTQDVKVGGYLTIFGFNYNIPTYIIYPAAPIQTPFGLAQVKVPI